MRGSHLCPAGMTPGASVRNGFVLPWLLIHSQDAESKDVEIVGEKKEMETRPGQGQLGSPILPCQHRNELMSWLLELLLTCDL